MSMTVADEILEIFADRGAANYFGESVSVTDHGLQAAHFAAAESAPPALIVAALLHDIGHLIEPAPADIADWKTDACHERIGAQWLSLRFPPEVYEPVRLHVPAKRYLCATDERYLGNLSAASVITLELQGGPMRPTEIARFESEPFHADALRVRRWDDRGKIAGLATAALDDYRAVFDSLAGSAPGGYLRGR